VINLSNASDERPFSQVDLSFTRGLSTCVSMAVQNAMSLLKMAKATRNVVDRFHEAGCEEEWEGTDYSLRI